MRTNVAFFKLLDPVVQSILFILFAFSLDQGNFYHIILIALALWQIASWIIHFMIKSVKLLKNERLLYMLAMLIYLPVYIYISHHIKEHYIAERDASGLTMYPAHEITLVSIGLIIAFWYYVICFREIKTVFKKSTRN